MFQALFQALAAGLGIWQSKESRRYLDKLMKLQKEWYAEFNKEFSDDAVLDNIEFELCILSQAFSSKVSSENSSTK